MEHCLTYFFRQYDEAVCSWYAHSSSPKSKLTYASMPKKVVCKSARSNALSMKLILRSFRTCSTKVRLIQKEDSVTPTLAAAVSVASPLSTIRSSPLPSREDVRMLL